MREGVRLDSSMLDPGSFLEAGASVVGAAQVRLVAQAAPEEVCMLAVGVRREV